MNGAAAQSADLLVPRRYQEEIFRRARQSNIIAALNTGSGKTFISLLLIKWIAAQKAHKDKAIIFLVPRVALVQQQGDYIAKHTSLRVIKLYGALDLDFSDRETWRKRFREHDVLVMTAQIFLNVLTHSLWSIDRVSLMVFDECHHARKNHPYNGILRESFQVQPSSRPKIFGMTASPIWDPKNAAQSLHLLEANMNAKVLGVIENYGELQEHSPKPVEIIKQYAPPSGDFDDYPQPSIYSCVKVFGEVLRGISNFAWSNIEGRYFVTWYNLGPYCASHFLYTEVLQVVGRLEQGELEIHIHTSSVSDLKSSSRAVAAIREIVDGFGEFFPENAQTPIPISVPLSWCTPKVKALVEILLSYYSPKFQTIIFVEQRQVAACLAKLLPAIAELSGKIHSAHFVGEGINNDGLSSAMGANIGNALEAFRAGAINALITTAVAEEGLDFPACDLVIRFDSLQHMVGYVQSRGRARNKASTFVVMIQENDVAQLARYKALKEGEPEVARVYLSRNDDIEPEDESDEELLPADLRERERYVVPGTGAILNYDNAIGLLNRLCALIPTDTYTPPHKPTYSGDFAVTLRLPASLPLPENRLVYHGPRKRTKKEAKRVVAFQTARRLRELDVLDEYLLPVPATSMGSDEIGTGESSSSVSKRPENMDAMVRDPWVLGPRLWVHEIKIHGRTSAGLVSGTRFPPDVMWCRSNPIEIGEGRLVEFAGGSEFDLRRAMEEFTKLGIYYRLTGTPLRGVLNAYLVPVTVKGQPDFNAINRSLEEPRGHSDWTSVGEEDYNKLLIFVRLYSGRAYRLRRIRDDITPLSPPVPGSREENFSSYRDYLLHCCGGRRYVPHIPTDGPMVELELVPRTLNGQYDLKDNHHSRIPTTAHDGGLFPQGCSHWLDLSANTFQAFELFPAICHRLTDSYRVKRLRSHLGLPPINHNLLAEALTLPSARAGYSNQRLETLGDAVLQLCATVHLFNRYPNRHEGQLSSLRHTVVCNRFLYGCGLLSGLQEFVTNESFEASRWRFTLVGPDDGWSTNPVRHMKRKIPSRSLQECVEAILGASFLSGGIPMALRACWSLGLAIGGAEPWYTCTDPPRGLELAEASTLSYFGKLEEGLGYEFCRHQILLEAVTHPSFSVDSGGRSYQRLEFLGDSVISLVVMEHLFARYAEATPFQLSLLRAKLVCNAALAWVAVRRLELHKTLLANSVDLNIAISRSTPILEMASGEDILKSGWRYHPPKVLSDALESVIGAVLVDSGYNYDKTAVVVLSVMQDLLVALNLDVGQNPVSRLLEWAASQGCRRITFKKMSIACGGKRVKGMVVLVHEMAVAGPTITASIRVSRFEAADIALKILMDEEGEKSLKALCTCRTDMELDVRNQLKAGEIDMVEDTRDETTEEKEVESMLMDVDECAPIGPRS